MQRKEIEEPLRSAEGECFLRGISALRDDSRTNVISFCLAIISSVLAYFCFFVNDHYSLFSLFLLSLLGWHVDKRIKHNSGCYPW